MLFTLSYVRNLMYSRSIFEWYREGLRIKYLCYFAVLYIFNAKTFFCGVKKSESSRSVKGKLRSFENTVHM